MSSPKISIIVPIYNVEKYIKKCLETIRKQTFTDFEVLLINDGTKDNSAVIAQKYCDTDKRFYLYNKKNGGISDARNYGLERAKGEYVVFIDSDDYIHKEYLEVLYKLCIENNADMSYCRFKYSYLNFGITLKMPISAKKGVISKKDALDMIIRDNYLHSYIWNKMFKKSLFTDNNIKYPNMYFEDIATAAKLLMHSNKLAVTDQYLYYYVKHFGSIMSTMNSKKINDYLLSILIIRNHLELNGIYNDYKEALCALASKAHIINWYSILRQHIITLDFRKMKYNYDINKKLYQYIISDSYKAVQGTPELPYYIHQPGRKQN